MTISRTGKIVPKKRRSGVFPPLDVDFTTARASTDFVKFIDSHAFQTADERSRFQHLAVNMKRLLRARGRYGGDGGDGGAQLAGMFAPVSAALRSPSTARGASPADGEEESAHKSPPGSPPAVAGGAGRPAEGGAEKTREEHLHTKNAPAQEPELSPFNPYRGAKLREQQRSTDAHATRVSLRREGEGIQHLGAKWVPNGVVLRPRIVFENPALMHEYTTILHGAKAARESESLCRQAAWKALQRLVRHVCAVEMCPKGHPLRRQPLDALGD